MNKTLIAAALLAGFAGAAQAQSNVTLYGIADAGFVSSKNDGQRATNGIDSGFAGGSRWGIRGSEDLGNGLKANFQLESGINIDQGTTGQSLGTTSRLFGRTAWVGLQSTSLGELRLGRQDSFAFGWFGSSINPFGNAYGQAQSQTIFGFNATGGTGDRLDNTALYMTPVFAGFQAGVGYSFNAAGAEATVASGAARTDQRVITSGLRYNNGPLAVVFTYDQRNAPDSAAAAASSDIKNYQLGATYDFGVVKAHAGYGRLQNYAFRSASEKENAYLLGLSVPFGAHALLATYQRLDNRNKNLGREDNNIDGFAIAYNYKLSKRTMVYAAASQYSDSVQYTGAAATRTGDRRELGFGIQHRF